jgi:T5orf172 domain
MPKRQTQKQIPDEELAEGLALLEELGIDISPEQTDQRSAKEERIIAGFEEIERFVTEQGRLPQRGADRDIFERLYAVRLDRLRQSEECRAILEPLDSRGLLNADSDIQFPTATLTDDQILADLGLDLNSENDIMQLTHVRSRQEIKAAEEIAQRNPCQDFNRFKPLFDQVQHDLKIGARQTVKYQDNATINLGDLFILEGQKVIVAGMGDVFISDYGKPDRRLRVVYDNGTESDLLMRSLQRALNKDKVSRRITSPDLGPLFSHLEHKSQNKSQNDLTTGYIYILRSQSDHPFIVENRSVIHKIGVTVGDVKTRIANAKKDPTYLLADVELIATFKLTNINPQKLESLIHKFFENARLELALPDRFGISVQPREWFLVPLEAIEAVIEKIEAGTIAQYRYDPTAAALKQLSDQ